MLLLWTLHIIIVRIYIDHYSTRFPFIIILINIVQYNNRFYSFLEPMKRQSQEMIFLKIVSLFIKVKIHYFISEYIFRHIWTGIFER